MCRLELSCSDLLIFLLMNEKFFISLISRSKVSILTQKYFKCHSEHIKYR